MKHYEKKKVGYVNKCFDLQGLGEGYCESLFNMVEIYDEMERLILQMKKRPISSPNRAR